MRTRMYRWLILSLTAMLVGGGAVFAQHAGHQGSADQVGEQAHRGCPESAKAALADLDRLAGRLERARQANSARDLRQAVADLQAALDGLRAQVSLCAAEDREGGHDHHAAMGPDGHGPHEDRPNEDGS